MLVQYSNHGFNKNKSIKLLRFTKFKNKLKGY